MVKLHKSKKNFTKYFMNYIYKNKSTSISASIDSGSIDSGLGFSIWAYIPVEMASCLTRTRCNSSFSVSP